MSRTMFRAFGVALALASTSSFAFGQSYANTYIDAAQLGAAPQTVAYQTSIPVPSTSPTPPDFNQPAASSGSNMVAAQYYGPPIIHMPGDKVGMYPHLYYANRPGELQKFVDTYGVDALQDAVDGSVQECSDIYDLQAMIVDYDHSIDGYAQEGKKLVRDLPRHEGWQMFLTVGQGIALGAVGVAAHSPGYTGAAGIGMIKQLGNDHWSARLDQHFLNGSTITVQGMKVFLASERIYVREMDKYCPILEAYVGRYGNRIGFQPVTQFGYPAVTQLGTPQH